MVEEKEIKIKFVKLYYRNGGKLPIDKTKREMESARASPTSHVPSTGDAFLHFVAHIPIATGNEFEVRH